MTVAQEEPRIPTEERQMSAIAHASALLGYFVVLGHFIPPLIIYLIKKDDELWVADQAKESLNFQLNVFVAFLLAILFGLTGIGLIVAIPLAILTWIAQLVFTIIAAVKAGGGECYRYPVSIRFV